jgi:hypothetical protein
MICKETTVLRQSFYEEGGGEVCRSNRNLFSLYWLRSNLQHWCFPSLYSLNKMLLKTLENIEYKNAFNFFFLILSIYGRLQLSSFRFVYDKIKRNWYKHALNKAYEILLYVQCNKQNWKASWRGVQMFILFENVLVQDRISQSWWIFFFPPFWAYYTVFSGAGIVSGTLHPAVWDTHISS